MNAYGSPPPVATARPQKSGSGKPGSKGKRPVHPDKRPRKLWVRIIKWLFITGLIGLVCLVGTVAFIFWMYGRDPNLPSEKSLAQYNPKQVIRVLDANDREVGELFGPDKRIERRTFVPYEKIPRHVVDCFVAAEDNRFWTHGGVDYWGMFRAALTNIRKGKTHGASTITQQVVKTFLLTPEKTFKRKIQEVIIARRLEKTLTKEQIMNLYLNQIYFGNNRYGVQEASHFYFGKDVAQLTVGEAAVLAALPQRPEELAPNKPKNQAAAKARQIYVLNQMVTMGKLTAAEAQKWIDAPIQVVKAADVKNEASSEWIGLARDALVADLLAQGKTEEALNTLGGTVRTSLDPGIQEAAQRALQKGLRAVDKRHEIGRPQRTVKDVKAEIAKLAKKFPGKPVGMDRYEAVVTAVHDDDHELVVDAGNYPASIMLDDDVDLRFNPPDDAGVKKKPSERFKPGDVVAIAAAIGLPPLKHAANRVQFAPGPQGAVVVIDVKTRRVKALVGGFQTRIGGIDRATQSRRQPGSSFKPFVYGAGIDSLQFTAGSKVNDAPDAYDAWRPKNYDSKFAGPLLLRYALSKSINTIAIRVTAIVKPENVAAFAKALGIRSELTPDMSISLGSKEVTPLEMTNAIASIAAGGQYAPPRFIEAINGKPVPVVAAERVMRPDAAWILTSMMASVVTSGTGHLAKSVGVPIAGKTGTSNDARDTWFVGFTPDVAIGVWIGYDEPRAMGKETGGTTAVPVFVDVAKAMNLPAKQFARPPGIVERKVDKLTGLLAPEGAAADSYVNEYFIEGTAPLEVAPLPDETTSSNVFENEYND